MSIAPPELAITRGLPGSGKSTRARQWVEERVTALDSDGYAFLARQNRVRVNRDDLRHMLFGVYHGLTYEEEQQVTAAQHAQVAALLAAGVSVIVDDTNLRLKHARAYADLAAAAGATFQVIDVLTDVADCIDRDAERRARGERGVGARVILNMADRYGTKRPEVLPTEPTAPKVLPYVPDFTKPEVWIVDLDGTLARKSDEEGSRDWHDYDRVGEDAPIQPIIDLVHGLVDLGAGIVFMSGRKDYSRETTREWLCKHLGDWTEFRPLFMRADDDNRSDDIVKAELFDAHVRAHYNVAGVLDDRDRVVKMWRSMGLTCLQVAEGNH